MNMKCVFAFGQRGKRGGYLGRGIELTYVM